MHDKLALNDKIAVAESSKEAARIVAEEIARQVAFHIESMYPEAVKAASSTFLLSVRGTVINEIMALKEHDKFFGSIGDWLKANDKHRRTIRKLKKAANIDEVEEIIAEAR